MVARSRFHLLRNQINDQHHLKRLSGGSDQLDVVTTTIVSRRASFSSRQRLSAARTTARGVVCDVIDSAAAMPAAWPIAMHVAIERADAWASWVAEKHRPATSIPSTLFGSRHR